MLCGLCRKQHDPVTREQFYALLYRYAVAMGLNTGAASGDLSVFTDSSSVSDWAEEAVSWTVGTELVEGMGDGTLNPGGDANRAQFAVLIMNYLEYFK